MPAERLKQYLDENQVKYLVLTHSNAFTSQEAAANAHISGKVLVKAVIVRVDGTMAMTVLPAAEMVDVEMLADAIGAEKVELAKESEFMDYFPGCERGAIPPFGNLYDMEVYVSPVVRDNHDIIFCAGSHRELIDMAYADFERLVQPEPLPFAIPQRTYAEAQQARDEAQFEGF